MPSARLKENDEPQSPSVVASHARAVAKILEENVSQVRLAKTRP